MQALIALAVPALALGFAPGALNALPRAHARAATGASEITMRTPLMAGNWKVHTSRSPRALSRSDAAACAPGRWRRRTRPTLLFSFSRWRALAHGASLSLFLARARNKSQMNPTSLAEAKELATAVAKFDTSTSGCAICVSFPYLASVAEILKGTGVSLGAQDLYTEEKGAFTGAVSPGMLKSIEGVEYCLAGHSERRTIFGDDDSIINTKVRTILDAGLKPILCIGETKEEYDKGLNKEVCAIQLAKGLSGVSADEMKNIVIAYEPVWAIGTGLTCPPEGAQEVHAFIRGWFDASYNAKVADGVVIQYGGSVTPETVDELMAMPDIDGALVGGASLIAEKFERIVGFKADVSA